MAPKRTRLTHKIAIKLQPVAEGCSIYSSRSRRPVRKLLDTPSYGKNSSMNDCKEESSTADGKRQVAQRNKFRFLHFLFMFRHVKTSSAFVENISRTGSSLKSCC
jgi:hypothetical protein